MRFVLQLLSLVALSYLASAVVGAAGEHAWLTFALGLVATLGALAGYAWVVRRTERRPVDELGRRGALQALGRGSVVGLVLFAVVIGAIALGGDYHVAGWGSVGDAVWLFGFLAPAAVTEELLFRGVLFRHVEQWFGTWAALVSTGLVFGMAHLLNPDATLWGALSIAVEAGGMLGAAYVATRTLWLPIGLHFAWNFAESGIFGTEVSGNIDRHGLLDAATSGSVLISGGKFGPEASIYALLVCLAVTAFLLRVARRRGHLVPARLPRRGRVAAGVTCTRA
ncbi:MAG: CPBP family intramembrane metalloprotease [Promicromonosporaceae bacterium]|nr:CPBP family intramembrane metalloprotease [Promicromonosporaceae bacterium]